MSNDTHLLRLQQALRDASRLATKHCADIRQTVAGNREMVAQSIALILDSKAALRRADETMGARPGLNSRSAWPGIPGASFPRRSDAGDGLATAASRRQKHDPF